MSGLAEPIATAAAEFRGVVRGLRADQLSLPTPCAEYDVRGLLNHLLYWAPRLLAAARKAPPPPPEPREEASRLVTGDWSDRLVTCAGELASALRQPEAWQGTTTMGWSELPASMIGRMVLCEFVVHGWDLATATGRPLRCERSVAVAAERVMRELGESGRARNVFGPEVPIAADAPALEKALAMSGRDPSWRSSTQNSRVRAQNSRA
ncbi:TIGR03086 family metal-binding protein [Prauserella muralis]|uniref:TIGR03086 family protein n=1 Tax=Prauserella muralis TaxID=588067 RepID=A0A2V4B7D9_9PSEU|nr:TIGR03086 family metal-binding protein [Prauserella muralis]PXY31160.1 TIGR03086 family protein [Prauserella muralis]TWE14545.1 uncharacterized protein (TIGR03086 family) [Prauserella muralis]